MFPEEHLSPNENKERIVNVFLSGLERKKEKKSCAVPRCSVLARECLGCSLTLRHSFDCLAR